MEESIDLCPNCGLRHDKELDKLADVADFMATSFKEMVFPEIWKQAKKDIKEMKKKEIAEEMFHAGAVEMLTAFLDLMHNMDKKKIGKKVPRTP